MLLQRQLGDFSGLNGLIPGLMRPVSDLETPQVSLIRAEIEPAVGALGAAGIILFYQLPHLWSLPKVRGCFASPY